jgi:hypothetical protein
MMSPPTTLMQRTGMTTITSTIMWCELHSF